MTNEQVASAQESQLERGTFEIVRDRLLVQAEALGEKTTQLNHKRLTIFGGTEMGVLGSERIRTENNRPPMTLDDDALTTLSRRDWPGNVRELANAIERLTIMAPGPSIGLEDLERTGLLGASPAARAGQGSADTTTHGTAPEEIRKAGGLVAARREFEAECIRECLRATSGNVSAAARLLGLDRTNLHKKITSLGIETERGAT